MSRSGDWFIRENPNDDANDSAYEEFSMIETLREEAISYVNENWKEDLGYKFFDSIWYASTKILPHLEVQVVIDSNNKAFVSTGSPGYVDFLTIDPTSLKGMKLPITNWIHTHPFGAAYFSNTDWRTVNTWEPLMQNAIVLGGDMQRGHYGVWQRNKPNSLSIYDNHKFVKEQQQYRREEE